MDELEYHEAAGVFPMFSGTRYQELLEDIKACGLIEPITLCEGKILDGRNRYRACMEAGVEPVFQEWGGDPWSYAWSKNGQRRDLVDEQRYLIWKVCEEGSESYRLAVESEVERRRGLVEGRDHSGVEARAREAASKTNAGAVARGERLMRERPDLAHRVMRGEMKPAEAHRRLKKDVQAVVSREVAERASVVVGGGEGGCGVHFGDAFNLSEMIPAGSCPLVIADPLPAGDVNEMYRSLGVLGNRVLVDGGSLLVYCSQHLVREVVDLVSGGGLSFFWVECCLDGCVVAGDRRQWRDRGVESRWRMLLWFVKGRRADREVWVDDLVDAGDEVDRFERRVIQASYFISKLTRVGDLVVDPFCSGGGVVPVAAKRLSRQWWSASLEADTVLAARERLEAACVGE